MEKAIIYCRVSSKEQVNNYSLPVQEKMCRSYCEANDFEVMKVYIEEGKSAKTTNRPKFKEMMRYCSEHIGNVQSLVVAHSSRFSRYTEDHLRERTTLGDYGVRLRSCTENLDETPHGRFIETIFAAKNQLDNDEKSLKTKDGMKAAALEGRCIHNSPLGYIKGAKGRNQGPSLLHDPEKAPLVKKAFEMYATGRYTKTEIVRKLNAMRLTSRRGSPMTKQSLDNMFGNEKYKGIIHEHKLEVHVKGDFKPIVSEALCQQVQDVMQGKGYALHPREDNILDYPLRKFTRCTLCGVPITGSTTRKKNGKTYPFYRCRNSMCKAFSARKDQLEGNFLTLLRTFKLDPRFDKLFAAIIDDVVRTSQTDKTVMAKHIKQNIAGIKSKQEQLESKFLYGNLVSKEVFEKHSNTLKDELASAELELSKCEDGMIVSEEVFSFGLQVLTQIDNLWEQMEFKEKLLLQKVIFPEGVEYDGRTFRTTKTAPVFNYLAESRGRKSHMGWVMGFEPTASRATT